MSYPKNSRIQNYGRLLPFHFPRRLMRDRVLSDRALGLYGDFTLFAIPDVEPVPAELIAAQVLTLPPLLFACLSLDDNEEDLTLLDCSDPSFADCFNLLGRGNRFCFTTPYW